MHGREQWCLTCPRRGLPARLWSRSALPGRVAHEPQVLSSTPEYSSMLQWSYFESTGSNAVFTLISLVYFCLFILK